jgi:hypothetical protein
MSRRRKQEPLKIEPGPVRDELMVRLINGATKTGPEKDRKKDENRKRARRKVKEDEES